MAPRGDPGARRNEILDAALRCYARKGYHRTTMDEIVAESGLSKGTLYWYFNSKRALFIALFEKIMNELMAPLQELFSAPLPASERLQLLGVGTGQALEASQEFNAFPISFILEAWTDEEIAQQYVEIIQRFADQVETLLKEGIAEGEFRELDTRETTWGIMALIDGIILYHCAGMPGSIEKQLAIMTDLVIEGLRKRSTL